MSTHVRCYSPNLGKMAPHILAPDKADTFRVLTIGAGAVRCDGCSVMVTKGEHVLQRQEAPRLNCCGRCGRERGWLVIQRADGGRA